MQDDLVTVIRLGNEHDPSKRLRMEWAESLAEHMHAKGMSRKVLAQRLAALGCSVSIQAVGQWLRGETSPRPHHQAAVAAALQAPVRRVFPIERANGEVA